MWKKFLRNVFHEVGMCLNRRRWSRWPTRWRHTPLSPPGACATWPANSSITPRWRRSRWMWETATCSPPKCLLCWVSDDHVTFCFDGAWSCPCRKDGSVAATPRSAVDPGDGWFDLRAEASRFDTFQRPPAARIDDWCVPDQAHSLVQG